jgi:adenosylcobinamide-phosphate synthase
MTTLTLAAIAILFERLIGYPAVLQKFIGHPVQWFGAMIASADKSLNNMPTNPTQSRFGGALALVLVLLATALPAWLVSQVLERFTAGPVIEALLATTLIAQKSLRQHVLEVYRALSNSLQDGRIAVAKIVGRDTRNLDESGVAKAALESLAENTADGIVAPVFWFAVLGLPGIVAYKVVNTADSMIGHKSDRYLHFGFAAAKLDDLVNLPASRLSALFFAGAAFLSSQQSALASLAAAWRDADKHRSPNAGWPESAMAGGLGLRFGGPRSYEGEIVELPYMGDGRDQLTRHDIAAGLKLYDRALWLMLGLVALLAIAL